MKNILFLLVITCSHLLPAQEEKTIKPARTQNLIINTILFDGQKNSKVSFLKRVINIKPGDTVSFTQIEENVQLLIRLPSVAHASYELENESFKKNALTFKIQENFTLIPQINFWTVNDDEVAYKLGLSEFNLLGRGIKVGGFYQNNGFDGYSFSIEAPYLFTRNWGLAANFLQWASKEPLFLDTGVANYRYRNISYELLSLHRINNHITTQVGINFFTEDYRYLDGATSSDIPLDVTLDKIMGKLVLEYNNLDYEYHQLNGYSSKLFFQYVHNDEAVQPSFLIGWNDFLYFKRIGKKGNWANRLRVGFASNDDSPFAPFAVDNNLNIRGVGNIIDRGTASLVLNTEYRHTIYNSRSIVVQSNVFIDAGTWRNPGGELDDLLSARTARVYPGVGFRIIHKRIFNAVLRVDYGYGITRDASQGFVFGIGQYF